MQLQEYLSQLETANNALALHTGWCARGFLARRKEATAIATAGSGHAHSGSSPRMVIGAQPPSLRKRAAVLRIQAAYRGHTAQ